MEITFYRYNYCFIFRFIYSRKCAEIKEYRMGDKAGKEQYAMFMKGKHGRLLTLQVTSMQLDDVAELI